MPNFSTNFFLALCFLVASTLQLSITTCLSDEPKLVRRQLLRLPAARKKLTKRSPRIAALTQPRIIVLPILGPLSFNNICDYGLGGDDVSVDAGTKAIAAQALTSVLVAYDEQHPADTASLVLEMRELYLQETGKLPHSKATNISKDKKDISDFFDQHPELQDQVQDKFASMYTASLMPGSISSPDTDPGSEIPNDWAHINPNAE